ncbi:hypothetical protein SALBM135S_05846 [Streptomyces alboniger]
METPVRSAAVAGVSVVMEGSFVWAPLPRFGEARQVLVTEPHTACAKRFLDLLHPARADDGIDSLPQQPGEDDLVRRGRQLTGDILQDREHPGGPGVIIG